MTSRTARPRRNNTGFRPRRPATTVPDFLIACAAGVLAMAAAIAAATVLPGDAVEGETARTLARLFAATLAVGAVPLALLAFLLLRGERTVGDHYRAPLLIGGIIGVVEAWFFLAGWGGLLWLPPLFLVFALRPLRRLGDALLPGRGRR
jgi:hypothetical protein